MKLLVTGASGFLGRSVIRAALEAGHQPVALVRPAADVDRLGWPASVQVVRGDLRQRGEWMAAIRDVDAVAHAAASVSGDFATQFAGTVAATENLLEALDLGRLHRFVHVSSFSVYDFSARMRRRTLTETAAIEAVPAERDAYTATKLAQERLVAEACTRAGTPYIVIRPGVIFGPGRDWDFGRALRFGKLDLIFSPLARFRLTYVDNCADAVVAAVTAPAPSGSIVNIVDDDLPTHAAYHRMGRRGGGDAGFPVYVPWALVAGLGMFVKLLNGSVFKGRARLPELLALRRQRVRWKPVRYSNEQARRLLGWTPRVGLEEAVRRTLASGRD